MAPISVETYVEIGLRDTAFQAGGKFFGRNPSDVVFVLGNSTNSNQGVGDTHQILNVTVNPISLTKQSFGKLGVGPRLELADLSEQGILYVKINDRVLNTFEIANFTYDIVQKISVVQDLAVAALNLSTQIPISFILDKILISFSGSVSETVTTYYVNSDGTEIPINTQVLVGASVYTYLADMKIDELDQVKVTCTNSGGAKIATAYIFAEIRWDGQ